VRALARSGRKNLRLIVNVGGPEVDLLIGTDKVAEAIYAFVGFEVMGLAPHFRRARQEGSIRFQEWTEFTVMAGLDAAIKRVPFLPTHTGLGTDLLRVNSAFRTIQDPFEGQTLLAVPALRPDVALIHVNLADPQGNGSSWGTATWTCCAPRRPARRSCRPNRSCCPSACRPTGATSGSCARSSPASSRPPGAPTSPGAPPITGRT